MMEKPDTRPSRKKQICVKILKNLVLYGLVPFAVFWLLTQPVGDAVRASDPAIFLILLAALGAVGLNWLAYSAVRKKRPSTLVFAFGTLCLLVMLIIEYDALPVTNNLTSFLAVIGGMLSLAFLLLLSFWFAARPSRPEHAFSVAFRIIYFVILFFMAYQIVRDFESKLVSRDTWITIAVLIAALVAFNAPRILAASRRSQSRKRATGLAAGWIEQVIGETHLDRDDDLVTRCLCRVQYVVDDELYEIRAGVSRRLVRKYGKGAFLGQELPVSYDPDHPADAYTIRIDKHLFDGQKEQAEEEA